MQLQNVMKLTIDIIDVQFNLSHSSRTFRTRKTNTPLRLASNAHMPVLCIWGVRDEGCPPGIVSWKSKTAPGTIRSITLIIKFNRLEAFYRALCYWVWCLYPLITATKSRVDDLEVKLSVSSSELFQLVQSGEQQSWWIVRVITESLIIRLSEEISGKTIKLSHLIWTNLKQSSG